MLKGSAATRRRAARALACAALFLAAGCGAKYQKVEDKVSKTTEAAEGMSYALPTTIAMGAITGTGGATYEVSTGEYNRKIDERIDKIRSTCKVE